MSYFALLNLTCTIQRSTESKDSVSGAIKRSWSSSATGVRCAVQVLSAKELSSPLQTGEVMYEVYFPYGTDVRSKDRLVSISGMSNITLEVQSPPVDDAGRRKTVRVEAMHRESKATQ